MTDVPPPGSEPPPPSPPPPPPPPPPQQPFPPTATYVAPMAGYVQPYAPPNSADRVRNAWHSRAQSDYIFDFATAFGWTLLTCGFYAIYIVYQLMRRSRDHNRRRIELLDAATIYAWERAQDRGIAEELRPHFERIAQHMAALRNQTTEFRDPTVFAILAVLARGVVEIVAFVLLDGDLITHDYAEGAVETELSAIYARLGAPIPPPNPARLKKPHNYVGRVIATVFSCGIYSLWWMYDVMTDGNKHFRENWVWEDALAQSVQQLARVA